MAHTHTTQAAREICGVTISTCSCGARKRSDRAAISGATISTDGWYIATARARAAYDRLENEGYEDGPQPVDAADEFFAGRE